MGTEVSKKHNPTCVIVSYFL